MTLKKVENMTIVTDGSNVVEAVSSRLVKLSPLDDRGRGWCLQIDGVDGPVHIHLSSKKRIRPVLVDAAGKEPSIEKQPAEAPKRKRTTSLAEILALGRDSSEGAEQRREAFLKSMRDEAIDDTAAATGRPRDEIAAEFDERDKRFEAVLNGLFAKLDR